MYNSKDDIMYIIGRIIQDRKHNKAWLRIKGISNM